MIDEELTRRIINAFYKVYNTLGHGFIESVYHNAMIVEIVDNGLSVKVKNQLRSITARTLLEHLRLTLWLSNV